MRKWPLISALGGATMNLSDITVSRQVRGLRGPCECGKTAGNGRPGQDCPPAGAGRGWRMWAPRAGSRVQGQGDVLPAPPSWDNCQELESSASLRIFIAFGEGGRGRDTSDERVMDRLPPDHRGPEPAAACAVSGSGLTRWLPEPWAGGKQRSGCARTGLGCWGAGEGLRGGAKVPGGCGRSCQWPGRLPKACGGNGQTQPGCERRGRFASFHPETQSDSLLRPRPMAGPRVSQRGQASARPLAPGEVSCYWGDACGRVPSAPSLGAWQQHHHRATRSPQGQRGRSGVAAQAAITWVFNVRP